MPIVKVTGDCDQHLRQNVPPYRWAAGEDFFQWPARLPTWKVSVGP